MLLNRPRAARFMRECGLDALVATSPLHITYFTDYYCWLDRLFKNYMRYPGASTGLAEAFAVLPLDCDPTLIINPIFAANASELWVRDIQTFGDAGLDIAGSVTPRDQRSQRFLDLLQAGCRFGSAAEALIQTLRERGLSNARIGLEMEGMEEGTLGALRAALPLTRLCDCSNLIRMIRMVKSPEELDRLMRAAEINEQAGREALAMARPGLPMSELALRFRSRAVEMGAEYDHFAYSPRGYGIATEPQYVLSSNDVVYVDFGCIFGHYFSDTGSTLAFGPLPRNLKARHDALRECIAVGADNIRPGVLSSAVWSAMWTEFQAHGFTASFPHGHGIGLEPRDYPILVPDNHLRVRDDCVDVSSDLPLEEGMVVNLEAGMFVPEDGSLQIERTLVVERTGCRGIVPQIRNAPFG
jgi:Xaa-Pro dipeptidase